MHNALSGQRPRRFGGRLRALSVFSSFRFRAIGLSWRNVAVRLRSSSSTRSRETESWRRRKELGVYPQTCEAFALRAHCAWPLAKRRVHRLEVLSDWVRSPSRRGAGYPAPRREGLRTQSDRTSSRCTRRFARGHAQCALIPRGMNRQSCKETVGKQCVIGEAMKYTGDWVHRVRGSNYALLTYSLFTALPIHPPVSRAAARRTSNPIRHRVRGIGRDHTNSSGSRSGSPASHRTSRPRAV
jgi:hypothetical protein